MIRNWKRASVSLVEAVGSRCGLWMTALVLCGGVARLSALEARLQPQLLPPIIVIGQTDSLESDWTSGGLPGYWSREPSVADCAGVQDVAGFLKAVPGAAVVRNGPQTGIVQLRGLSGDRVRVAVDGATITPACPNHMDPPLHYASASGVQNLNVLAGITPVSAGGDNLGGAVQVDTLALRFATNHNMLGFGEAMTTFRSSNDGWDVSGQGGVANDKLGAAYQGSWQTANDLRFPGGRVRDTSYDTQQHGVQTGLKTDSGLWSVDAKVTRTRDAGTPALPMDMIEDDAWRVGLRHAGEYTFGSLESRFYYHSIEHLMDNYSLRPAGAMRMFSPATSDDLGFSLGTILPRGVHSFGAGVDFHRNAFDAHQQNAVTGLRQDTLNEAERSRVGVYAEWQAAWSEQWMTLVGVRSDTVWSDAANVEQFFAPSRPDALAFNAQNHSFIEPNFDAMACVRFTPNDSSSYELGFARKNRAPSLLERYLWTPLSASAGQADGRTYLGTLDLDSEVSHQVSASARWFGKRWEVRLTPFYNHVSDYIQGTPISRLDSAGKPVLQFQNVSEAELYGAEGALQLALLTNLIFRTSASYVRGRNLESDDNLYRIAPFHGNAQLEYRLGSWQNRVELEWAARQSETSAYNAEPETPGSALLHLETGYRFNQHFLALVGVQNIFDEHYADHLGGINRVTGSDVAVGERIPGAGRFIYVSANVSF
ncbi:MAG TPA: TonB-dependent receptor [Verrucomicrobiae bacterium]